MERGQGQIRGSPFLAQQWVTALIDDLNVSVMEQDVAEAEQAIAYLRKQLANTSLVELRGVFARLIEEQSKVVMLAQASSEYLLKTIDPAVAPEIRTRPNRRLIVILGAMLGFIVGATFVLVARPVKAAR